MLADGDSLIRIVFEEDVDLASVVIVDDSTLYCQQSQGIAAVIV